MDMKKLLLPATWGLALIGVYLLSSSLTDKSLHFFGLAGEPEQEIAFQYPVEIVQFFVVEGKQVKQGDVILEVKRHELDSELNSIDQQISQYTLKKQEMLNSMNSQLATLQAKKQVLIADIDYKIHELQARLKMNKDILDSISESSVNSDYHASIELQDLQKKRRFAVQAIETEINHLKEQINSARMPIDAQLKELRHRKNELQRQTVALTVKAKFNGRIGGVNFKTGDLVPPYQAIMSVHSSVPRYVKGYIHEDIINDVNVGQRVWIKSLTPGHQDKLLSGVVESLGNRIVEYPQRLKKNPLIPAWGREVIVRIRADDNNLLFGEKVQVLLSEPQHSALASNIINTSRASNQQALSSQTTREIQSDNPDINTERIEASGIVWISQASHFLLVSDETYKNKTGVFVMNQRGMVEGRLSKLDDHSIDDIESISTDGRYVYLLASLSYNKKDKLTKKRKRLLRFKYQNQTVSEQKSVNLYRVLKTISETQADSRVGEFLQAALSDHSMNIEAHFVNANSLYLGFKSPHDDNRTLIIKLSDLDSLFDGEIPRAEIWRSLPLFHPETGEPMQLSDMALVNGELLLLGTSRSNRKDSVLWRYQPGNNKLESLKKFPGLNAEGVSFHPASSQIILVFDEGKKKHSNYLSLTNTDLLH